jgi:hypothetical protein
MNACSAAQTSGHAYPARLDAGLYHRLCFREPSLAAGFASRPADLLSACGNCLGISPEAAIRLDAGIMGAI